MKRSTRFVEIGDHVTPLKRHFLVITDDSSGPAVVDISARLVTFLQEVLATPSLLAVGPVSTPHYSVSHDGEKWSIRG
jgi:hypothetical protein